jgi:type I restriction enzyme S subunit
MELTAGYKGTDAGVIPDGWSVGTFGEVCRVNQGLQVAIEKRLKYRTKIAKIYITIQFLNDRKSIEYIETYPLSACCSYDDVLMTRTGNTGIVVSGVEGVFHNNFFKINFNKKILVREYLISFLCLGSTRKTILMKAGTSTIPDLNHSDFYSIPLPIPPVSEQRKIAIALADVDALIAGLEKLIAKKRDIKQAVMQQLLTGQTRLPGFSGEWKVKRLGEICEISMGRTPSRLNPAFWGAGHVWLSIADLHGKVLSSSKEQITPLGASSMRVIPKGTLLMSFKLSIGRLCFAGCDLYTNEAICGFNNLLANSDYLYYALSRTDLSLYGKQAVKGYTLNKKSLALVEVALPSDVEQAAIANVLSSMDAELSDVENRLAKTRDLKQGMMQELLTGRTRLV